MKSPLPVPDVRRSTSRRRNFTMQFDIGTIKHLGLQMYSTLPPVIGELVSNAWDADAKAVRITIPTHPITETSEIVVEDDGIGMTADEVQKAYLVVGRDRREVERKTITDGLKRPLMGRKGIGKFSAFGIAGEIEIETVRGGETSRFLMNYEELKRSAVKRQITLPCLPPTGTVSKGTKVTLRKISKYKTRSIQISELRRLLARRFSVIGAEKEFEVQVNSDPIKVEERDLKRILDNDTDGNPYIWEYNDVEIEPDSGWKVSGWIGAMDRTKVERGIQHGIAVMARGKLVQEPFVFDAVVGQQYALSYLVGELHAEFVDDAEDTISTTRNSLVWDNEANAAFKAWGVRQMNQVAREWGEKRARDNEERLVQNPLYQTFQAEAQDRGNQRALKVADKLIRDIIKRNPAADVDEHAEVVQMCLDFIEFDAFWELAQEVTDTGLDDTGKIMHLFREWEVVEAKEMMRVTEGRIATIEKLQRLIETNALEVPTLHKFLKEFPWVLDPRWTLVADEKTFSQMLRDEFPEADTVLEQDRRIDFLCVREGRTIVVVEIKRPAVVASEKELRQVEEYVNFIRHHLRRSSDPEVRDCNVVGYLLCGDVARTWQVQQRQDNLATASIYVKRYSDLLRMVHINHEEFLERYKRLREAKASER